MVRGPGPVKYGQSAGLALFHRSGYGVWGKQTEGVKALLLGEAPLLGGAGGGFLLITAR